MGVPTSEVGYTSAIPRTEDHEVHKRTCGGIGPKKKKDSFLYLVLLFQVGVSKISSVLLLNVDPLFSSVPKLPFQISMLL